MKTTFRCAVSGALALALAALVARADEGMWLLTQVAKLPLREKGLQIDPAQIYRPGGPCLAHAIVQVDGGTGELVSPDGLILTNHHVVFDGVQQVSAEGKNYVDNGFLARTREAEPFVSNYDAIMTLRVEEVTDRVLEGLASGASEEARSAHIRKRNEAIVAKALEEGEAHLDYRIVEHFNGARFFLYTRLILPDVRLVYAPPKSIGEFGGETDNFMWPRHCADFGLLRAYTGPDGRPAKHAKENIPFRPQTWLKISTAGVADGDFTFVMGHPGQTMRERSAYSMRYHRDFQLPQQITQFEGMIKQLEAASKESEKAYLENVSTIKGIANALKNYLGKVDGMKRRNLVELKEAQDAKLREFLAADPARQARWGGAFPGLEAIYSRLPHRDAYVEALNRLGRTDLYKLAERVHQLAVEKKKPDAARRRPYRDDQREKYVKDAEEALAKLDRDAALKQFADAIAGFAEIPDEALPPELRERIGGLSGAEREQALRACAEELARESEIGSDGRLASWMNATDENAMGLRDPLVHAVAKAVEIKSSFDNEGLQRSLGSLRRQLYEIRAARGGELYPDANSTLRLTYGFVKGYSPRDAVQYAPVTTLRGVLEKETGEEPFASPAKLLEVARAGDFGRWADKRYGNSVPVAFTHTVDITGGNSGSPALNAKGELVGIVFDGNWESLTADYIYDETITRCISVDIRYCMFVLDRFDGATELLAELGFKS